MSEPATEPQTLEHTQTRAVALRDRVGWHVACSPEPFLVPDVTPGGESFTEVFHILRDMVDEGTLVHGSDGYRRPA